MCPSRELTGWAQLQLAANLISERRDGEKQGRGYSFRGEGHNSKRYLHLTIGSLKDLLIPKTDFLVNQNNFYERKIKR